MTHAINPIPGVTVNPLIQIDLTPEDYDFALKLSESITSELSQWHAYIQALGMVGFTHWLQTHLDSQTVIQQLHLDQATNVLQVGANQLALLASEQLYDGLVDFPQALVEDTGLAVHFYVVLEVLEEQAVILFRGFIRYDQLVNCPIHNQTQPPSDSSYQLPLSWFKPESSLLISQLHHLDPVSILPRAHPLHFEAAGQDTKSTVSGLTHLGAWLQNIWDDRWQTLDDLFGDSTQYAYAPRNLTKMQRGKCLDIGLQFSSQSLVLLLTVTKRDDADIEVLVQLLPIAGEHYLPAKSTLTMLSDKREVLQSVQARPLENLIQLRPFSGNQGDRFQIQVKVNDIIHAEEFEF